MVASEPSRVADACAISSTARLNAASFAADGFGAAAELPHELQCRRPNLIVGHRRLKV